MLLLPFRWHSGSFSIACIQDANISPSLTSIQHRFRLYALIAQTKPPFLL